MLQKILRSFELWRNAMIKAFCRVDTEGRLIFLDFLPKPSDTLLKRLRLRLYGVGLACGSIHCPWSYAVATRLPQSPPSM